MKKHYLFLVFSLSAILGWGWRPSAPPSAIGKNLPRATEKQEDSVEWKNNPACQLVFFAVLEGLYTDGVPSDVVDSLIPKTDAGSSLKANFVAECPLCHPVYEALALYQKRGAFRDETVESSTFGVGLSDAERQALKSASRMDRLQALRPLVRRWVERRMSMMRLSKQEHNELSAELAKLSQQGKQKLMGLMRKDPDYNQGWSLYWGCAACNGATDACQDSPKHEEKAGNHGHSK